MQFFQETGVFLSQRPQINRGVSDTSFEIVHGEVKRLLQIVETSGINQRLCSSQNTSSEHIRNQSNVILGTFSVASKLNQDIVIFLKLFRLTLSFLLCYLKKLLVSLFPLCFGFVENGLRILLGIRVFCHRP